MPGFDVFRKQEEDDGEMSNFFFLSEQEFVQQVSENTVSIFPQEDRTVRQSCQEKITILPNITGLTTVTVPAGCKLVSEKYTFGYS